MIEVLDYNAVTRLDIRDFVFINNRPAPDPESIFFCYFEDSKLAGILRLHIKKPINWFSYIEVLPEFRKRGIAKALIKYLFIYTRSNKLGTISVSHFTQMGSLSVKHTLEYFAKMYNVHVIMDQR